MWTTPTPNVFHLVVQAATGLQQRPTPTPPLCCATGHQASMTSQTQRRYPVVQGVIVH